jgi:hypothetical protein
VTRLKSGERSDLLIRSSSQKGRGGQTGHDVGAEGQYGLLRLLYLFYRARTRWLDAAYAGSKRGRPSP